MKRYILVWLPMSLLAFANAALRELIIVNHFADLAAHQLSTLTLVVLCTVYTGFIFPLLRIENRKQALQVGLLWMVLVVAFEFSLGLIANRNWRSLLEDYNIFAGRIWPVFLLWILLLPYFYFLVRKAKPGNTGI